MPRTIGNTNNALNRLYGFTFTERVWGIDLTDRLVGVTIESASLASQSSDDADADEVEIINVQANDEAFDNGAGRTVAVGKGIQFQTVSAGAATHTLRFSYVDSDGNTDGIDVMYEVE